MADDEETALRLLARTVMATTTLTPKERALWVQFLLQLDELCAYFEIWKDFVETLEMGIDERLAVMRELVSARSKAL